ncbi:MAG: hypothetical protein QOF02_1371 [Blastocatellia bacterium]|jgi:hypothetical protein|nr:hypothetical protein [Blastocatellia bacterium]
MLDGARVDAHGLIIKVERGVLFGSLETWRRAAAATGSSENSAKGSDESAAQCRKGRAPVNPV